MSKAKKTKKGRMVKVIVTTERPADVFAEMGTAERTFRKGVAKLAARAKLTDEEVAAATATTPQEVNGMIFDLVQPIQEILDGRPQREPGEFATLGERLIRLLSERDIDYWDEFHPMLLMFPKRELWVHGNLEGMLRVALDATLRVMAEK
jgi:hypothetical protein